MTEESQRREGPDETAGSREVEETMSYLGLRGRLRLPSQMIGTFIMIPRVEIVEMAAIAGFDAVVFDLEHGAIEVEDLPPLCAAAAAGGAATIARIASHSDIEIGRALDMGVDGIIVPHVSSISSANAVVDAGRFPPMGTRSLNPYVRGLHYAGSEPNALDNANSSAAFIAMIEGSDAVEIATEIGDIDGIDGLFIGPVDLAGELGFPGQPEHPEVVAVIRKLIARLCERGVATAIYAPNASAANRWFAEGVSLVVVSADNAVILDAFRSLRGTINLSES
jgi:2-keto-3-deoxy-L-rhamnonate aldolase RhmA